MMKKLINIEYLKWDSGFFGFKTGKIVIYEVEDSNFLNLIYAKAKEEEYNLLYIFTSENLISEINIGNLVDTKTVLIKNIEKEDVKSCALEIVSYRKNELDNDLLNLALQSGEFSRFKVDCNFKKGTFENLYKLWIEKSIYREIASEVFVYLEKDAPIGFITIQINGSTADIGLFAVNVNERNKAIGKKLLVKAEEYCKENFVKNIRVVTQRNNISAMNFYQKNGFKLVQNENIYHKWLK